MEINNFTVTPNQMKTLENASHCAGVSLSMLMDNAGKKLAEKIDELYKKSKKQGEIIILAGNGNNAGDGFVCAEILRKLSYNVKIILTCGMPKSGLSNAAYYNMYNIEAFLLNNCNLDLIFKNYSIVIDCIFGTGFHGELTEEIKKFLQYVNSVDCIKIACDIPSGACALNGYCSCGTLKCDYTITFGAIKTGMLLSPAREMCGEVVVADIGIPDEVYASLEKPVIHLNTDYIKKNIPKRKPTSHKVDFGKLVNICGSRCFTGAAGLSTLSALRSGVGICTLASTEKVTEIVGSTIFEATYLPLKENENGQISYSNYERIIENCKNASTVLIGCGLGISDDTKKLVSELILNLECPIILDADGINAILDRINILRNTKASIILTPHPGEFARLLNISTKDVLQKRVELTTLFSKEYGVTVVSKGSGTIIATPDGKLYISTAGNSGLSRGGSGDVLAGMIASFSAQGLTPENSACAGVFLHGTAADNVAEKMSMQGMLPSDVINELPLVFKAIDR